MDGPSWQEWAFGLPFAIGATLGVVVVLVAIVALIFAWFAIEDWWFGRYRPDVLQMPVQWEPLTGGTGGPGQDSLYVRADRFYRNTLPQVQVFQGEVGYQGDPGLEGPPGVPASAASRAAVDRELSELRHLEFGE